MIVMRHMPRAMHLDYCNTPSRYEPSIDPALCTTTNSDHLHDSSTATLHQQPGCSLAVPFQHHQHIGRSSLRCSPCTSQYDTRAIILRERQRNPSLFGPITPILISSLWPSSGRCLLVFVVGSRTVEYLDGWLISNAAALTFSGFCVLVLIELKCDRCSPHIHFRPCRASSRTCGMVSNTSPCTHIPPCSLFLGIEACTVSSPPIDNELPNFLDDPRNIDT